MAIFVVHPFTINMRVFFIFILCVLSSFIGRSQVYVKNNHSVSFRVALAYYESGSMFNGWITKGWFEILPGEEKAILHYNPTGKHIYYYAYSDSVTINGNHLYLVDSKETFTIKDADKETTYTKNRNYLWHGFREIKREMSNVKNKYIIQLGK